MQKKILATLKSDVQSLIGYNIHTTHVRNCVSLKLTYNVS